MASPRWFRAGLLAAALVALASCRAAPEPPPNQDSYYPLQLGQQWVYDTRVYGPQARSTVSTTAVCRIRLDEDGDRLHLVSTCADGALVQSQLVYQLGDEIVEPVVFGAAGDPRPRQPPATIARLNLAVGDTWRWVGQTGEDDPRRTDVYRVANRGHVWTEAGQFEAVRVLVTQSAPGAPPAAVERWYARRVGLVKEVGVALFPTGQGGLAPIELVRTLKETSVRPIGSTPCCQMTPPATGG